MCTDEYVQHTHLENKGCTCPSCRSDYLKRQDLRPMWNGTKKQKVTCDTCGTTWTDTFELTGFTDLKPKVPEHFLITLSRSLSETKWVVIPTPRWGKGERACGMILETQTNLYAEYLNCGIAYRMIRAEDAAEYGIGEINPEWALNPEDIA